MKRNTLFTMSALVLALFAVGCNNNTKGSTISPQNRNPVNQASTFFPVSGGYSLGQGRLYLAPQYAHMMTEGIHKMLAAYIDPANIGEVDGTNGVIFRGKVTSCSGGALDANSGVEFEIRDSFVGKNENGEDVPAIKLGAAAVSCQYNGVNSAKVVFSTNGADYTFEGTFDQTNFTGVMSFQNKTSYVSSEPLRSGQGIAFQVQTCQFFVCN